MLDVEVKNFQSIECVNIQVQGFTALVGRSNIGKSSVVRAVKAALTGAPSSSFVRHSSTCLRKTKGVKTCKCHCSVSLKSDGFDLLWEKGDAINRYTFNGQVYDKAERGTPEFLHPVYAPVKIGDDKELLQVSDQFNPIFLLNQTGGVVADVLSDVAHLDRVNGAIRLAEKDRKDAASSRKVRELDLVILTSRLVLFDGLDMALTTVRDVEDGLDILEAAERGVAALRWFLERGTAIGQHVKQLELAVQTIAPESTSLVDLSDTCRKVSSFIRQATERKAAIVALQAIASVEAPDSDPLQTCLSAFESLRVWSTKITVIKTLKDRVGVLNAYPEFVPDPLSTQAAVYNMLAKFSSRYDTLTNQVVAVTKQYTDIEAESLAIQAEWTSLGVCPTCTQSFHGEIHTQV